MNTVEKDIDAAADPLEKRLESFKQTRFSLLSKDASFGFAFLTSSLLFFLFFLLYTFLPATVGSFAKTSLIGFSALTLLRYFFVFLLPVVMFTFYHRIPDTRILGTNPGLGVFMLSALAGIPFSVLVTCINNLLVYFFLSNRISLPPAAFVFQTSDTSSEAQALLIIVSVVIPVFLEELLFRGFFYAVWPEKSFVLPKILISAVLYSAFSFDLEAVIPLFITGLLLGFIRQSSGNLLCSILTRAFMLVSVYFFSHFLPVLKLQEMRSKEDFDMTTVYTSLVAALICLISIVPILSQLYRVAKEERRLHEDIETSEKVLFVRSLGGLPFFISLLVISCIWVLLLG